MEQKKDFVASLTSVSNITVTGDGEYRFLQSEGPVGPRIDPVSVAAMEAEVRLEESLLEARKAYLAALNTKQHTEGDRNRARANLRRLELKSDLCRRVNAARKKSIIETDDIFDHIDFGKPSRSAILVMDIRKSTNMMLKSQPLDFSKYINDAITRFIPIITSNDGIFEKFTGDGYIAVFVESLVGRSVAKSIKTALECKAAFSEFRNSNDAIFNSMLIEYGIAFGIDYGDVYVNSMSNEINIVGSPVVYASRMASGKKDDIVLSHQARLAIENDSSIATRMREVAIIVKGEAPHQGWRVAEHLDPNSILS